MPAKKKPVKKEEISSSDSDSSSSSSSGAEEKPVPKKKALGKAKAKAEAAAEGAEEKEAPAKEGEEAAAEKSPSEEEKKAAVFEPPPRAVFKPHTDYPEITAAEELEYCPTCGLPPDFCQYGPSWAKCQPWCMEKYPHYYPELSGLSLDDAKKKAQEAADKTKVKELPGGKKKRDASPGCSIKMLSRGGRKCVTSVAGLDLFGVKLDDAAKKFKKKFSCGASVVQQDNGQGTTVDIQGDFGVEVTIIMTEEWGIPEAKIENIDGGTKKKGKGPGGR